jgi:hypothetical protein
MIVANTRPSPSARGEVSGLPADSLDWAHAAARDRVPEATKVLVRAKPWRDESLFGAKKASSV